MSRDEEEIGAVVAELYEAISGPAGARDWARFESLFAPGARLMPSRRAERGVTLEVLTPAGYASSRGPLFAQSAFYEREVARRTAIFGDVAHVWSAYAGRFAIEGPEALRGINSIQLHRDEGGWRVVSILWDSERPGVDWPGAPFDAGGASRARRPSAEARPGAPLAPGRRGRSG